ncbi:MULTISPECIES: D-amino-acid transaminase [Sphingobium]|uniref:Probable branched-chain-amino-acid aminotransferase n=1 Tax=Sphingobium fuliginis (strain ATCC 27551) TaxID=336203 RepID=A0ABQ1F8E0_SPHSA|nr:MULTISPECIES: D-amino-acid transaminase [Sphingobium]AJR24130.1 D-amino acid aminotransferase [Sphingobium sp. YBL2]RYL99919.1 D-amino-acid transaminase [Sphingobium fuliginis]WDA36246.1 D-amino-acid transaminase [Sphingobium sp. YC-XJ3]GGA02871.1 D-amino-acid transaminase [Sphingobium fuliginis]
MSIAYLNGRFLPLEQAQLSVLDRGFLFADGIYEVAAVIDGKLVDSASHLARLERSTQAIGIALPLSLTEIEAAQKELVARNALAEGLVYLQITRGADATRDFLPSPGIQPTLVMFVQAKPFLDVPAVRNGIAVATMPDLRWARRDIKSVGLLAQAMAKRAAAEAGAQEAWMVEDGFVTEGASSTAFIVTEEGIVTRPYSQAVLAGCTGAALTALAEESGIAIVRRPFTVAEALAAKEAFITSASTLCQSVVRIDGRAIGDGKPGPLAMRLRALYIDFARRTAV